MSTIFDDLMTGLDEADAFLAGERAGYNVTPPEGDVKSIGELEAAPDLDIRHRE
jgi:hypothetical protein